MKPKTAPPVVIPPAIQEKQAAGKRLWKKLTGSWVNTGPNDVPGQRTRVYGSYSSALEDLEWAYFHGLKTRQIKDFHVWSSYDMETIAVLLDFDPPLGVGTRVDLWLRHIAPKTHLFYWEKRAPWWEVEDS